MLAENAIQTERMQHVSTSPRKEDQMSGEDLLELYLTLPHKLRQQRFGDTAHAAEITGLTQRTIQLWIEFGAIRAIPVGRKYKIDLESLKEYLKRRVDLQA